MEIKTDLTRLKPLVAGNTVFRSAYDFKLSAKDLEKARIELNETDDLRKDSLRNLKERLSRDGIKYQTDDAYLLSFLRCRKFKCKEAYEMIKTHYSTRNKSPDIFGPLPSHLEAMLDLNMFLFAPYRDEEGSLIFVDRIRKWKPADYTIYEAIHFIQILTDIASSNPACQLHKVIFIMDFKETTLSHFSAGLNPAALKLWLSVMQNLNPWRVKRIMLLNCHKLAHMGFNNLRFILKKKIVDRIVVMGSDMNELHKYVNPVLLPEEYGGSLKDSECSCKELVMKNVSYLRYVNNFFMRKK